MREALQRERRKHRKRIAALTESHAAAVKSLTGQLRTTTAALEQTSASLEAERATCAARAREIERLRTLYFQHRFVHVVALARWKDLHGRMAARQRTTDRELAVVTARSFFLQTEVDKARRALDEARARLQRTVNAEQQARVDLRRELDAAEAGVAAARSEAGFMTIGSLWSARVR